ncbi:hypothetical protein T459_26224 [Capsicum annuum]|uniref:Uncharacterized protein n=1 Tax=Capsicum annuum TaxID=4072 RepID=A0A2G2YN07_CAPAN|nr:hypothetical protein T459_26224 [Capsicum annuum]
MNEMDEATENAQISSENDQATTNHDFGSTSMGCTQEFTQALENLNIEMEDNELDDANNEVNGNDPEDESKGCDMTIQHDKLSKKEKLQLLLSFVGVGVTMLTSTPKRKKPNRKKAKQKKAKSNGIMLDSSFFHSLEHGLVITW